MLRAAGCDLCSPDTFVQCLVAMSHPRCASSSRIRHQLGNSQRRVRVVQLDGNFFRKGVPISVTSFEATYEISQRAGDEKIFLHEAKPLSEAGGVVRVEDPCECFGFERLSYRADKISVTERMKLEVIGRLRSPKTKGVDVLASISHYRPVIGDPDQGGPLANDRAQCAALHLERAIQPDLNRLVRALDSPKGPGNGASGPAFPLASRPGWSVLKMPYS